MLTHAPSIRKGKKWALNRIYRSSSSPTFPFGSTPISEDDPKTVGLDAPQEPIWHSIPEASSVQTHGSEQKLKEKEKSVVEKGKQQVAIVAKQCSRETTDARRQIVKGKE